MAAALCVLLGGCYAVTGNPGQSAFVGSNGAVGPAPSLPASYRADMAARVWADARDRYSFGSARISQPQRRFVGVQNGGEATVVCLRINTRNRSGAYVGTEEWTFVFDEVGQIANVTQEPTAGCSGPPISYQPFPELEQMRRTTAPARRG